MTPDLHDLRELHVLALWRHRAGSLAPWARGVIVAACALSIAIALLGPHLLWTYNSHYGFSKPFWLCNGAAIFLAFGVALALVPRGVGAPISVAIAMPALHLGAILLFLALWLDDGTRMTRAAQFTPMLRVVPIYAVAPAALALAVVVGLVCATGRGRRTEVLQATVTFALAALLLVGLWIPIATRLYWGELAVGITQPPYELLAFALGPPLVAAGVFTALAARSPRTVDRLRSWCTNAVVALFLLAMLTSAARSDDQSFLYANFIHIQLAFALAATASLIVLGLAVRLDAARARRALERTPITGVVGTNGGGDDDIIATIQVGSWLRGPRALVRAFTVVTEHGEILVPGARLAAPLPPATTQLARGESIAILRAGDKVVLGGMVIDSSDGSPFRGAPRALPGADVVVGLAGAPPPDSLATTGLAMWRPSVAYLLILVAIGLPAVAGALFAL